MPKAQVIDDFMKQASLLICAHGSPGVGDLLRVRVASLQKQGCFAEIAGAALYDDPKLESAIAGLTTEPIFVVPLFMSAGVTFSALGERLAAITPPRRTVLCQPLGSHPDLPARFVAAATQQALAKGWRPDETGVVLVGHGSRRSDVSRRATETVAATVADAGPFAEVAVALLEGGNAFKEVLAGMKSPNIVVMGCFAEQGRHVTEDLPALVSSAGRPAVYEAPISAAPWCDQLIIDQAERAAAELELH